ncbi:universal stress protein [uncultured Winogradskyella sp.]|uniref:universal stress protein n=1 Tax=uncultured Winogradskyella sp. TaxID=395353 RepID=UPI002632B5D9|nr:universal stress protein [uncultured Winogradskyella sp.]
MKNILLLTDFSENSINAIRYALQQFESDKCNFSVLNVQSSSSFMSDDLMLSGNQSLYDSIIKKTKDKLDELVAKLKDEFETKTYSIKSIVDYDNLTDSINQIKTSKNIDLVVMGSNGVTGASEVIFGSNTINVIRKVDCPTLVIPKGFKYRPPNEILLPLDLTDSLSGNAFADAVSFVKRFGKKIHLLRIKPNNEDSEEELKDKENISAFLKEIPHEYHVITGIPIELTVDSYTQTHHIDLTILLVQKESLFERFFTGSPTTKISNNIRVPLLIFHS